MTERDFFYWLQGYVELRGAGGASVSFTPEQAGIIAKHIALVVETSGGTYRLGQASMLISELQAERGAADRFRFEDRLRKLAHGYFEHVVDPADGPPETQDALSFIHGAPGVRC